jgi:hypothetical protein
LPALLAAFPSRTYGAVKWHSVRARRVPFFKKGGVTVAATAADSHGASLESTSQISIPQIVETVKKMKTYMD